MKKRCVFLTGATGYLGSNLIPEFIKNGCKLKLLVRAKKTSPYKRVEKSLLKIDDRRLSIDEIMQRAEIIEGDITARNLGLSKTVIDSLSKEVTDIFHCAAAISFDEEKENMLRKNNIEGTKNVLSFAKLLESIHFHYMSTAYVCGQRNDIVRENELNIGQKFNNKYENIKCMAEEIAQKYSSRYNFKATIYRPSVILGDSRTGKNYSTYGPYGILRIEDISIRKFKKEFEKGHPVLKKSGAEFINGIFFIPLRVIGSNSKTLNVITIDYALEVIIRIFLHSGNAGKTFHITNSNPPTVRLLKDCISELLDIEGIEFVGLSEFRKNPMKPWERIFNKSIGIYTPYLLIDEPRFDNTNTQNVLKGSNLKQPHFDKDLIIKLLGYSRSGNYGKSRL